MKSQLTKSQCVWYASEIPEILKQLNTQLHGLDKNAVQNRLKVYGPNSLKPSKRRSFIITAQHQFHVTGVGYNDHGAFQLNQKIINPEDYTDLTQAIRAAILCNDAELTKINDEWSLHGNPMDGALLSLGLKAELDLHFQKELYPLTDLIPFESEYKFMDTLHHDHEGKGYIYVKGAPEKILAMCSSQLSNGQQAPIDKHYWLSQMESLAIKGQRILAIAMRSTSAEHRDLLFNDVENELTLLVLFGLLDPPRKEAIAAVAECQKAGMRVKMITGDYAATAESCAKCIITLAKHLIYSSSDLKTVDNSLFYFGRNGLILAK